MRLLGNIIWFIFGGFITSVIYLIYAILWSITIIGIPIGIQCLKFARLELFPFGYDVEYSEEPVNLLVNIIWVIFFGWEMALSHLVLGALFCITIIGIPFGLQHFKLAKLSILPLGAKIVPLPEYKPYHRKKKRNIKQNKRDDKNT